MVIFTVYGILMTAWQLPDNFLINCLMAAWQLPDKLPEDCLKTTWQQLDYYQTSLCSLVDFKLKDYKRHDMTDKIESLWSRSLLQAAYKSFDVLSFGLLGIINHYHAERMDLNPEILIQFTGNNATIFRTVSSSS